MLLKLCTLEDPDLNHVAPMWTMGRVDETTVQGGGQYRIQGRWQPQVGC